MMNGLFFKNPLRQQGTFSTHLGELHRRYKDGDIQIPDFQRDWVWKNPQVKRWCIAIQRNRLLGSIITYQLVDEVGVGGGTEWLLDGRQRLTATDRLLQNPDIGEYGGSVSEFRTIVDVCAVSHQHVHYRSHQEAMEAFQDANSGTQMVPYDYYKGNMTLANEAARTIHERVPDIFTTCLYPIHRGFGSPRGDSWKKGARDSLSTFYYWSAKQKLHQISYVGASVLANKGKQVEHMLVDHVGEWSVDQVEEKLRKFEQRINEIVAMIQKQLMDVGLYGKNGSDVVFRALIVAAIWCSNMRYTVDRFWAVSRLLLKSMFDKYGKIKSRVEIEQGADVFVAQFQLAHPGRIVAIGKALGISIDEARERSDKAISGYHVSHVQSFARNGNGPTIIEPAPANLMRGVADMFTDAP